MKPNQRFIAGTTCPKCDQMDSLLLNLDDNSIQCVDCGFTQTADERDQQKSVASQSKSVPKKVDVSHIIRVNNLKE